HTHNVEALALARPSLGVLLGLGVAGGLLPDPGALAILLASVASGRLILGLFTVVVFSVGFASVLVLVGVVAARVGQIVLAWLSGRWPRDGRRPLTGAGALGRQPAEPAAQVCVPDVVRRIDGDVERTRIGPGQRELGHHPVAQPAERVAADLGEPDGSVRRYRE